MKQTNEIKLSEQGLPTPAISVPDRFRGALLGLAVGDAVGTTLEFKSPGSFHPIDDMVGGGPFDLAPGQWTDDTSMALCLAASLVENRGFDPRDQMDRYVRWWKEGYMSANGRCFDIGNTVRSALVRFLSTGDQTSARPISTPPATAPSCGSLPCRCSTQPIRAWRLSRPQTVPAQPMAPPPPWTAVGTWRR